MAQQQEVAVRPLIVAVASGAVMLSLVMAAQFVGRGVRTPAVEPGAGLVQPVDARVTPRPTPSTAQVIGTKPHRSRVRSDPHDLLRSTGSTSIALTFDDGPDPRWTPQVLDALRRSDTTATFCVVGSRVRAYPHLVRQIAADGHTLCNHSWNHDVSLGGRSEAVIRSDLRRTSAAILAAVAGATIPYYRQPGGEWTARVVKIAQELGMASLHWTVDPQDWRRPLAGALTSALERGCRPGAIILLHDGGGNRASTIMALRSVLPTMAQRRTFAALPTV